MKKLLLTTAVLLASISHAATSVDLPLSGTVEAIYDLQIDVKPEAASLNIVAGETNELVAEVTEKSNALDGYKILMKSANGSELRNTTDGSKKTTYTVSYDGETAVPLSTVDQTVKTVSSLPGLTEATSNVNVNVAAYGSAPAGIYTDTITITISAN